MTYFEERMKLLGVTEEKNNVTLDNNPSPKAFENAKQQLHDVKIFEENKDGDIEILLYTLRRKYYTYPEAGIHATGPRTRYDVITRHNPENEIKKGRKYTISGKTGTHPWFHPFFLDAFEQKTKIPVLTITEGAFKAWKATDCGIPTVGLSSITHYKDKNTQTLHPEILEIISACQVERVVILWDGDCLNISANDLTDKKDLYKRPGQFFSAIRTITDLLKDYIDDKKTTIYFAHINSKELEKNPKGMDDLLIDLEPQIEAIKEDYLNFDRPGLYFTRKNVTTQLNTLQKYFRIDSVNNFYAFHSEQIGDKDFIFHGSNYKHDGKELKLIIPAVAKDYFRVGDQYYKKIEIPNKYGNFEKEHHRISKQTIVDDHGKGFTNHIQKYNAFCVVPDHVNYQQVINNCYNSYAPFEHTPEEGECPVTLGYIRHIFGEQYEMGLDYVQLLFKEPQRKLPILCLVSKENKTGKTTFLFWLKAIFTSNVAIVGNSELSDNFNSGWSNKLIVGCDESFIEKKATVEKIKALSTADKIFVNAKGRDHVEMDFFAKFILVTNNEENFIYANEFDTRYWVRKVPVVTDEKPILKQMMEEIPAFLHMLNKRKMHKPDVGTRMYFTPKDIETSALKRVVEFNAPTVVKELKSRIGEMFLDFGVDQILMTAGTIRKEFFNNRFEINYLNRLLKENLLLDQYKNEAGEYVTKRHEWPKYVTIYDNGTQISKKVMVKDNGRPYVFKREDFVEPGMVVRADQDDEIPEPVLTPVSQEKMEFEDNDIQY